MITLVTYSIGLAVMKEWIKKLPGSMVGSIMLSMLPVATFYMVTYIFEHFQEKIVHIESWHYQENYLSIISSVLVKDSYVAIATW